MPKKKKAADVADVATFHLSVRPEGPHRIRILNVEKRLRTRVSAQLRDCAGAAERRRFHDMQNWGIDHYFDTLSSEGGAVRIAWLEYQDDDGHWVSCTPDVDAGDQFSELQRGLQLLQKLGEVIERRLGHMNRKPTDASFTDPDIVFDALRNSKTFVEVERFEVERRGYWLETVIAPLEAVT